MLSMQKVRHLARCAWVTGALTLLATTAQISHSQNGNASAGNNGNAQNPNQEILDRLDTLEAKIDDLAGEQVTATFCISQGREFGIGADWLFKAAAEVEGGVGWAEVFSGEGTAEVKFPFGPMPSEVAVGGGASHGRGFDICIDLPIELGPTDAALLAELAADINDKADDFPNRGKFQRRTHRLLNYTKRRVPGVQIRTDSEQNYSSFAVAAEPQEGADDEFDIVDNAIENLLSNGIKGDGSMFGVLKNNDIANLAASFDAIPADITSIIADPSQILDPLSDAVNGGIDSINCATFGIDSSLRAEKPGLGKLCNRLEGFPDFSQIEQVLSGELIANLYDALDTLTVGGSASKVADSSRNKFCSSRIGQLFKYDVFCKR